MVYYDKNGIAIRYLQQSDAQIITDEEIAQGWQATIDKYEKSQDFPCHLEKVLLNLKIFFIKNLTRLN